MSDSPVNRIPSISQLMELRPLKDLAHKVSSSTVAAGVKAYLQPYQKLAMEAAPALPYTSLQSLASEISDWILGEQGLGRPEVINASGQVLSTEFPVGPLSDEIVVQAHARRHDYLQASSQKSYRQAIEQLLCDMTGAESALVLKDRKAAAFLLAQASHGVSTVVPRSQMSATFDGIAIPKLLEEAGVKEIGSSNETDLSQLATEINGQAERLFWFDRTNFWSEGAKAIPPTADALEKLKSAGASMWVTVGVAGLETDSLHEELGLSGAKQAIQAGANVVMLGAGFLLGGPGCGIVVGNTASLEQIAKLPIVEYLRADSVSLAELEACLRIHQSGERIDDRIPVRSLLSTMPENLDLRATRLAEQLVSSPWITEAQTESAEVCVLPGGLKLPTRHIVIQAAAEGQEPLLAHLQAFPSVASFAAEEGRIVLDMRTVFPRNDAQIVSKLVPENGSHEGCEAGNPEKT